jgi:hypothetical protein
VADTQTRVCTCILLDLGGVPCGEPVEVELVMGCVHEHMEVDGLCAHHRRLALAGALVCTVCAPLGFRVTAHVLKSVGES